MYLPHFMSHICSLLGGNDELIFFCIRKRQPSPEYVVRKSVNAKPEVSTNGRLNGPSQIDQVPYDAQSPRSNDYEETDVEHQAELLDRRYPYHPYLP